MYNSADTTATDARSWRSESNAAKVSLVVSVVLTGVKFGAYALTHSNAIFSDAMENIANFLASCFALYAIDLAHRPADKEHPYGHGKIEFFSAGIEGGMVLLAGVLVLGKVTGQYLWKTPLEAHNLTIGLILMGGSMVANGLVGLYLRRSGRRTGALTLEANGIHLLSDALDSAGVLAAVALIRMTGWQWPDTVAAIALAIYMSYTGLGLVKRSAAGLMDEQDATDQKLIRQILDSHIGPSGKEPRICSYHKVRHRHSGRYHWVDFHIMIPAWWDVDTGHRIASSVEYEIEQTLGEANATAHVEPCTTAHCPHCQFAKTQAPPPSKVRQEMT